MYPYAKRAIAALTLICSGIATVGAQAQSDVATSHALSMYGDVKYGADFPHFDYADPNAPKGGKVRLAAVGTYDTLNQFIIKGVAAAGLSLTYDSLLVGSADEPFTEYGLLAETIEMPEDRSWVAFTLRPEARWHDGQPVTVDDVIFTFETLTAKGNPFFRTYYADVTAAEKTGERTVRFTFRDTTNRELPLIIGQMTVLPKHYWEERAFDETTLEPPLTSGPYQVDKVDPGRSITYRRVEDYWGANLPVNLGQNNFDEIQFDYYRDATVAIEALKANEYDFRQENISKEWATAYDFPAVERGLMVKEEVAHELGTGMQGFVFNMRRSKFADPKVRQALAYAFDFEWTNINLFYGQYTRTKSYYSNSELASRDLPEGLELGILEEFRGRVPEEVFTTVYEPPATDGSGDIRDNLLRARELLAEAGWVVKDNVLTNDQSGEVMEIEFLLVSPAFERIVGPVVENLKRLGITASIRIVDPAQYQNRLDGFDFDMITTVWGQSQSPGNEQRGYWTGEAAVTEGSQNYAGISEPTIDELVELLIAAPDRETLVATTRALDRVLLWGHYVIPHWHIRSFRLIYWDIFGKPATPPRFGLGFPSTWWIDANKHETVLAQAESVPPVTGPAETTEGSTEAPPQSDPTSAPPARMDEVGQERQNLSIWLALAGFGLIALVLYLRRRRAR